ncbi:pyridoxamine 5'-phosphate oxidase family protein [Solirubrobacter sp. CPCC 204708]|uniref:Pyridoxamine 5'-phosphate oxidase family protein n=1 Tax=Solirubrobacter deserti TaxID=2282478 RepID=A0ABT4RLH5_9ACTN|nr:pyridoxamine 5'-phosphate oxidase family protein [Solirubrobacter deserti]MBE2320450.1 pyridoxamine 5'-phosphate oxidase family protein [Solirubrobacter deserti]MDA0139359.1 pyridoxamine 5'-phosphate oxidase family protein [Solirubrobacter deserti]
MATWSEFEKAAPELAERVKASFDAHKHKFMATLRKDGAPRISGTEVEFRDGELWLGSMPGALKAKDLLRDPRVAVHNGYSDTSPEGLADAKLAGLAVAVPHEQHHLFRFDIREASVVTVNEEQTHLVIDVWTEHGGLKQIKRT